ncbi:MAG TPA: hypothetical protein VGF77_09950 [Allosphingosinicella sp.]
MGGFILATANSLGGILLALILSILMMLASYRFLAPDYKGRKFEHTIKRRNDKTRKAVDMGKSVICELAKSASITVLFHTVGIDALSL